MTLPIIEKEIEFYYTLKGEAPVIKWIGKLDNLTKRRVQTRILRLSSGNYGDFKKINKDILELRLDFGSGYRVYFAEIDSKLVLLICGGDKKTQKKDIENANAYFNEYRNRK